MVGVKPACELTGVVRSTYYRKLNPKPTRAPAPRPTPPNALSEEERRDILYQLHRPEHADLAVAQIWARLLDEDVYLVSVSIRFTRVWRRGWGWAGVSGGVGEDASPVAV